MTERWALNAFGMHGFGLCLEFVSCSGMLEWREGAGFGSCGGMALPALASFPRAGAAVALASFERLRRVGERLLAFVGAA